MADRVDGKAQGLDFTLGEFQQVRYMELFRRPKVPPRGLSGWVDQTRESKFLQLTGHEEE
jgi:hypothetical protein